MKRKTKKSSGDRNKRVVVNDRIQKMPGTGATAKEIAGELGDAINTAFKNYVPQPEKLSAAVTGSLRQEAAEIEEDARRAQAAADALDAAQRNLDQQTTGG